MGLRQPGLIPRKLKLHANLINYMNTRKAESSPLNIIAIVLFLIVLLGSFMVVQPMWAEVGSLKKGNEEKQSEKTQLYQQLTELQAIQQELNDSSEVVQTKTLDAIPERYDQDELIRDVTNIVEANKIKLDSISFGVPLQISPGQIVTSTLGLSFTGTSSQLMDILRDIEASPRKMLVKNIAVAFGKTELGTKTVTFSLNIETYSQGYGL